MPLRQKLDELDDLARNASYLTQEINAAYERHEELLDQRQKNDLVLESLKKDILYKYSPQEVVEEPF
ncbi:MAG: hypothetical protein OXG44_10630 [Gammaproteobacteria bacterium]|nr:hypothetical protein [Gammaproteobacteria bacterium]